LSPRPVPNNEKRRRGGFVKKFGSMMAKFAAFAVDINGTALARLGGDRKHVWQKATAYDDEIARVAEIWTAESSRLYQEALAAEIQEGVYLTPEERWKLTTDIPECAEHQRLSNLQEPHYREMDKLVAQMWSTPAHTPEGRQAKVWVLLGCILRGDGWRETDDRMDYEKQRARDLLIEFVGGEPGASLRNQFA
jgi:hypothetical protein